MSQRSLRSLSSRSSSHNDEELSTAGKESNSETRWNQLGPLPQLGSALSVSTSSRSRTSSRKSSNRSLAPLSLRKASRSSLDSNSEHDLLGTESLNAFAPSDPAFTQVNLEPLDTTFQLCVETLEEGYIDSYIDLFTLSHRDPVLVDPVAEVYFSIPPSKLHVVKNKLVKAEKARHDLKFEQGCAAFQWLAEYFEKNGDKETAIFFYEKNLENAHMSSNSHLEAQAYESMALAYERHGEMTRAIDFLEKKAFLSEQPGVSDQERVKAQKRLMEVYMKFSEDLIEKGNIDEAILFYERCREKASSCNDASTEGEVAHKLGDVYRQKKDLRKAIEWELQYLKAAETENDSKGIVKAYMSLANDYERLNDSKSAAQYLERAMTKAENENGEQETVRQVCRRLGLMYDKMQEYDKAVGYLERSYELEKKYGSVAEVDQVCVQLGLVRGNRDLSKVMQNIYKAS